ncbi:MAG: hypothetical protein J6G98_05655 [Bacilli bacterium]|nr:hypothetical protein [Bacilli bacterium]
MDLIILLVLIAIIVIVRKEFKSFIYSLGVIEIFFRVLHFIANNLGIVELSKFIRAYIPSSIISIFAHYSNGLFYDILVWIFVIFMGVLDYYLFKYLIKRK